MVNRHEANRFISEILMLHTAQAVVQLNDSESAGSGNPLGLVR